jgi:hypothetical protein
MRDRSRAARAVVLEAGVRCAEESGSSQNASTSSRPSGVGRYPPARTSLFSTERGEVGAEAAQLLLAGDERVVERERLVAGLPRARRAPDPPERVGVAALEPPAMRLEDGEGPEALPALEERDAGVVVETLAMGLRRTLDERQPVEDDREILGPVGARRERGEEPEAHLLAEVVERQRIEREEVGVVVEPGVPREEAVRSVDGRGAAWGFAAERTAGAMGDG